LAATLTALNPAAGRTYDASDSIAVIKPAERKHSISMMHRSPKEHKLGLVDVVDALRSWNAQEPYVPYNNMLPTPQTEIILQIKEKERAGFVKQKPERKRWNVPDDLTSKFFSPYGQSYKNTNVTAFYHDFDRGAYSTRKGKYMAAPEIRKGKIFRKKAGVKDKTSVGSYTAWSMKNRNPSSF
jgi:hypothetical protein